MSKTTNNLNSDTENLNLIFSFQNIDSIDSEMYTCLENIASTYNKDGLTLVLAKAYFLGLVTGKRKERKRRKT